MRVVWLLVLLASLAASGNSPLRQIHKDVRHLEHAVKHSHLSFAEKKYQLTNVKSMQHDMIALLKSSKHDEKTRLVKAIHDRGAELRDAIHLDHANFAFERELQDSNSQGHHRPLVHTPKSGMHSQTFKNSHLSHNPHLKHAEQLVKAVKKEHLDHVSRQQVANLQAASIDLEILNETDDKEQRKELEEAVKLRVPSLETLVEQLKTESKASHRAHKKSDFERNVDTIDSSTTEINRGLKYVGQLRELVESSKLSPKQRLNFEENLNAISSDLESASSEDEATRISVAKRLQEEIDELRDLRLQLEEEEATDTKVQANDAAEESIAAKDATSEANPVESTNSAASLEDKSSASENTVENQGVASNNVRDEEEQEAPVDIIADRSLQRIEKLEQLVTKDMKIDSQMKDGLLSNLKGINRDVLALADSSLSVEQREDLEAAMKLRLSMLHDSADHL